MSRLAVKKTRTRKQNLKVADPELAFAGKKTAVNSLSQDFEGQMINAQKQIEELRFQQNELARQKEELEEINAQKEEFITGQIELTEKFTSAVSLMDREIFEMKQEVEDLEHTRDSFALHLEKIDTLDSRNWRNEELKPQLGRALSLLDQAEDDYDQAVELFRGGRSQALSSSPQGIKKSLLDGIAFHTPVLVLGAAAILVYIFN